MGAFLLTINIYLWNYSSSVKYVFPVKECTTELMYDYKRRYLPNNGYKAIAVSCKKAD